MILVGSVALNYWFPGFRKDVKDIDLVGTWAEAQDYVKSLKDVVAHYPINSGKSLYIKQRDGTITEIEISWHGSRAERLEQFVENQTHVNAYQPCWGRVEWPVTIPDPDFLYAMKMSHRFLKDSPHFLKTMEDIHKLRALGCTVPGRYGKWYRQRKLDTYVYSMPKLNQSKDNFFGEETGVLYTYDHDSIHEAVKVMSSPAYEAFKPADSEVMVSKKMWDMTDEGVRKLAVYEESCVLALERSRIPYPNGKTPEDAFKMALMKVCTSITSGWFRGYAWENYEEVLEYARSRGFDYEEKFAIALANGIVKPFKGE